jgi:predicted DNA-binding transcriptional regulator YafY
MSNDEYKVVKIPLIANLELESLILSYGTDIEVLKPEWFRDKIVNRLSATLAKYNKN